jgi:hypothetical protein
MMLFALAVLLATGCSGPSPAPRADATAAPRTEPLALTDPEQVRGALGDFPDRCEPPEAELPFLLVCVKFPKDGPRAHQPATLSLQAFATGDALRRKLQEARASFDDPIPDDPADPENNPAFESGLVLGDTWAVGVAHDGPIAPILEEVRARLGGEIVAGGKVRDNLDEAIRRLGAPA